MRRRGFHEHMGSDPGAGRSLSRRLPRMHDSSGSRGSQSHSDRVRYRPTGNRCSPPKSEVFVALILCQALAIWRTQRRSRGSLLAPPTPPILQVVSGLVATPAQYARARSANTARRAARRWVYTARRRQGRCNRKCRGWRIRPRPRRHRPVLRRRVPRCRYQNRSTNRRCAPRQRF